MNIPEDDKFLAVTQQLADLVTTEGMTPALSKKITKIVDEMRSVLKDIWDDADDFDDESEAEEEEELCPACRGDDIPKIIQMCPAPLGWKAVFAETDSADPTKMAVDDVVAFGVIELPGGDTDTTGIVMSETSMVPCIMVNTFIGYLKPGQDPSVLASKVSEFLKEQRK